MARFSSEVSTGKAARKGSLINQTGTDVGPKQPPVVPDNSQFRPAPTDGVVSSPKGASLAQRGGRGAPPAMPGDVPLLGHQALDPTRVGAEAPGPTILSGNHNPVRSKGRSTTEADRKPLLEAD